MSGRRGRFLLDWPPVLRLRRNHALEHATMRVLGERRRGIRLAGHAATDGFYVYGEVPAGELVAAAEEGLRRLRAGRRQMALHPNCGTNLAVAGVLAGVGASLALGRPAVRRDAGWLERLARLSLACALAGVGVILARPVGLALQAHMTTEADVGDLAIIGVTERRIVGLLVHHVRTRTGG